MTTYELLFETKALTAAFAIALAVLASAIAGDWKLWWRIVLFGYGPCLAPAFYLSAFCFSEELSKFDLFACFLLEFAILFFVAVLLKLLIRATEGVELRRLSQSMVIVLAIQAAIALQMLGTDGYGVFSEGSRIDYLFAGSLGKYVTYFSSLLMIVSAAFVAARLSRVGSPGLAGITLVVVTTASSILAGSKGAGLLWLISVPALMHGRGVRVPKSIVICFLGLMLLVATMTTYIATDFFGLTNAEFAELAFNRFFLNNDARALAFDQRSSVAHGADLVRESFRSLATLLGYPPMNSPLGVALYGGLFGTEFNQGANTSLAALLTYYSTAHYVFVPALFAICGAAVLALSFRTLALHAGARIVVLTSGLFCLQQYSQDFLAFQVVLPQAFLLILSTRNYELRITSRSGQRSAGHDTPPQHHHSGA